MEIKSYEEAIGLLRRYPYFTYAALCAERMAPDAEERQRLHRIVELQKGDAAGPRVEAAETPEAPAVRLSPALDSADAIDIFLANYSDPTSAAPLQYIPGLDRPGIAIGAVEEEPPAPEMPEEEEEKKIAAQLPADEQNPELEARNLIKNHKYEEALAIIEALNLNNPEKSIYFADQIRFLKKLIINQAKANG